MSRIMPCYPFWLVSLSWFNCASTLTKAGWTVVDVFWILQSTNFRPAICIINYLEFWKQWYNSLLRHHPWHKAPYPQQRPQRSADPEHRSRPPRLQALVKAQLYQLAYAKKFRSLQLPFEMLVNVICLQVKWVSTHLIATVLRSILSIIDQPVTWCSPGWCISPRSYLKKTFFTRLSFRNLLMKQNIVWCCFSTKKLDRKPFCFNLLGKIELQKWLQHFDQLVRSCCSAFTSSQSKAAAKRQLLPLPWSSKILMALENDPSGGGKISGNFEISNLKSHETLGTWTLTKCSFKDELWNFACF